MTPLESVKNLRGLKQKKYKKIQKWKKERGIEDLLGDVEFDQPESSDPEVEEVAQGQDDEDNGK